MIPQYRPIYTPVHVHLVCGSILFPSSGGNSLVAKLSSGKPGVVGSSPRVSTSPLTHSKGLCSLQGCAALDLCHTEKSLDAKGFALYTYVKIWIAFTGTVGELCANDALNVARLRHCT